MRRTSLTLGIIVLAGCLSAPPSEAATGTPIRGHTLVPTTSAQKWAAERKGTATFVSLAPLFWEIAPQRGWIRPEVAYAQSAKETAFGRFGGTVDASFHNPCGMKVSAGGGDGDPNAHQRFATWRDGITACVDHLALYAGAPGYPRVDTPDPRHFSFLLGTATSVQALGGKWAPSTDYGTSIVNDYLGPMDPYPPPPVVNGDPQPPYWVTWDVAEGMSAAAAAGGWTLDAWGGIHTWGGAPTPDKTGAPYWPGWDIARDIVVNQNGPGGWILDAWGGTHAFGGAAQLTGAPYWPGFDNAKDMVVRPHGPTGPKGYTLDMWGGVHTWN